MELSNIKKEQKRTEAKKKLFLGVFSMTVGHVTRTCKLVGIHRDTYYDWRKTDSDFDSEVSEAAGSSLVYLGFQRKKEIQEDFPDWQREAPDDYWKKYLAD